ncbi:MAG: methyl-accepting chemotaxis protein [Treponema sp.]|nr:methyl-accepting chemotaxis protein [Treponema sp.]
MFFSRLKISTKLFISSAVFLIPIGVMLVFFSINTAATIQKSVDAHNGIMSLKPAVNVMLNLPEYLNVYLGLKQGDLRNLDDQIGNALRSLDKGINQYNSDTNKSSDLLGQWDTLKKTEKDNADLYQNYLDFENSIKDAVNNIGEGSRLILVSDINTYYFIASAISAIPEAALRLLTLGNLVRQNLYSAADLIDKNNSDLAAAQALGRRLTTKPYDGRPEDIPLTMFAMADLQQMRNIQLFLGSDRERISGSLESAMEENNKKTIDFTELENRLARYRGTVDELTELYGRMFGFNIANPCTAQEFMETVSNLNYDLNQLWAGTLDSLDIQIINSTSAARGQMILYLVIVLVTLGIAIGFVVFITMDISSSVRTLKALFRGLNENDLTLSLHINSADEFGELMKAFNGFLDILRSTFGSFKQSTKLVADSVFDLSSSSREITTTANQQSASVSEIVSTMEGSKNLSEQIAHKTTEVANLATQTRELSSKGAELREASQVMMEDIRNQNQKIIAEIRNLSDMIIRISEAIKIIDSIADQTKLIAFNASLEASSSGEAGARFSVVASEIRRFADNVVESTREIKQKIEEVQGASQTLIAEANNGSRQIETGYERMSEQKIVFEHIVENSQDVATRSQQISNLSKQQELASTQIFGALKEISAGVKQFVIATSSTSKIADSLNGMSVELKGKVEKYRTEAQG